MSDLGLSETSGAWEAFLVLVSMTDDDELAALEATLDDEGRDAARDALVQARQEIEARGRRIARVIRLAGRSSGGDGLVQRVARWRRIPLIDPPKAPVSIIGVWIEGGSHLSPPAYRSWLSGKQAQAPGVNV